jgi:predicted ArsR family transcriptional regulator
MHSAPDLIPVKTLDLPLNSENFLKSLLNHLSGSLQDIIGLEEAEGFISIVGSKIGEQIDAQYRSALAVDQLSPSQLTEVLVDLKARIGGQFSVIEESSEKIVFGNKRCPFGSSVFDRPALCMMTSNVFGVIAAENTGYAKISIDESIALNHDHCKVTVHLSPNEATSGREYYASN